MAETFGTSLASWSVPEYEKHYRSLPWYIGYGCIAAGLLIYSIISANYLFALLILIVAVIVYMQSKVEPQKVEFRITTKGMRVGGKEYRYQDIRNFWILYDPPEVKKLYFTFRNVASMRLMLPLKNQNPLKIREILAQYIDEDLEKEEEPISELIGRWTRF